MAIRSFPCISKNRACPIPSGLRQLPVEPVVPVEIRVEHRGHGLRRPKWALSELRRRQIPHMLDVRLPQILLIALERALVAGDFAEFERLLQLFEEDLALLGLSEDEILNELFAT